MFAPLLKAVLVLFVPFAVGTSINVQNSGNPVDSVKEAKERIVADVKEGYSHDHYVGYELND